MKCTQCKWHKNKYDINAAPFIGNPNADIVFMGGTFTPAEGSATRDAKESRHFDISTMIGEAFHELLSQAGVDESKIAIMNAHRCYNKNTISPSHSELNACFMHTFRELNMIKPKLVVAMGNAALYQSCQKTGVTNYYGGLLWSEKIGCKVYVVPHPKHIVFNPKVYYDTLAEQQVYYDRIPEMLTRDPDDIKLYNYTYIANAMDYAKIVHPKLTAADEIYFDLETTGLDPYDNDITLLIVGTDQDNIFVIPDRVLPEIQELLTHIFNTKTVVGQGYEFDAKFLDVKYDLFPKHWGHNTMLAEFVLTGARANKLRLLTGKYDPDAFGYDDDVKEVGGAHMMHDLKTLCQYAANDVGVMFPIAKAQRSKLIKLRMDSVLNNITIPCSRVLTKMSLRGLTYDLDALDRANAKYVKLAKVAYDQAMELPHVIALQEALGKKFNPKSSLMIRELMTGEKYYHEDILKKTKIGLASVTQDEMKIYAARKKDPNEYAQIMEKYRGYEGIQANFLSGVKEKNLSIAHGSRFGVAHTNYSLHIAATGRPTSSNPNLQNIPKDEDIKRVYVARSGYVFIYADLSQIEVRVAAMMSQDPTLMKACNTSGIDFHSIIASEINGYEYDEFYAQVVKEGVKTYKGPKPFSIMRNNAKTTTFGIMYGMSEYGLAYRLGMTVNKAKEFIEHYFLKMPQVRDFMKGIENHVITNGWVSTYFGFRRYFVNHTKEDHNTIREAQNHPIQGTAWNLMQLILIELDRKLEGTESHLIMQTYDSAVIEAKLEEAEYIAPMMKRVMTSVALPYELLKTVEVKTEIEIGPNLRDLKKVDV